MSNKWTAGDRIALACGLYIIGIAIAVILHHLGVL